ncbi:hypothetical protein SHO565_12780 [Streptomyces sp. HO565]
MAGDGGKEAEGRVGVAGRFTYPSGRGHGNGRDGAGAPGEFRGRKWTCPAPWAGARKGTPHVS